MGDRPDPDWRNHAHWDHGAAAPAPTRTDRFLAALAPRLRRAHLPRHPGSSLLLVAIGALHFYVVGRLLADLAAMTGSTNPALQLAAWALLAVAVLPGFALVATGAWDLARGPLRHAAQRLARSARGAD
jgi:hypothetical protein